jgi:hypothetical protein
MSKLLTIPVIPDQARRLRPRVPDDRYLEGQRLLVQAMRYLAKDNPGANREAVSFLSEHFRTQFRMSDHPSLQS